MTERPRALASIQGLAEAAVPGFTGTAAQVDAALPLTGGLHPAVAREAARTAELLLRLGPPGGGRGQLDAYRQAFVERYGRDREVPLLELLDPDQGLGPPGTHPSMGAGVDRARVALRDETLRAMAVDALRARRLELTLEPSDIALLDVSGPSTDTAPVGLDVAVMVIARSAAAIDAGDFRLLVGPNLGGQEAGRNLGRFGDLLGDAGRAALAGAAAASDRRAGDAPVELVYLPRRARSANVVVRPVVQRHEVVVGTTPGVPGERAIPLSEILIGLRDGRFVARWPGVEGHLVPRAGHMLNPHGAPAPVRFLEDVARDGRMQLGPFDWGPATGLPFLPRVSAGRTILAPAQWRIDRATRDRSLAGAVAGADFAAALGRWREEWMVPRHAYLAMADNRLLLDLEAPEQAAQLADELRGLRDGAVVLLQEPLPGPEHAWLPGPHGGHLSELVVPVALRATAERPAARAETAPRPRRRAIASAGGRLRPPGGDWLYLKLYAPRSAEDELLAGPVHDLCRLALGAGLADGWFFVRYSDPDAHLRLRFHGEPARLTHELLPAACDWGAERIAEGLCTRIAFDTYERELERYGGPAAMDLAETVFAADSTMVVESLRIERRGAAADRTGLAAVTVDLLLDGLGLDEAARLRWYGEQVADRRPSSDDFRARQRELRRLLAGGLPEGVDGAPLVSVLAARARELRTAGDGLRALDAAGALETPLERLCQSFVHLHCNRLLGSAPPSEGHLLALLLRTRESLARAPLAHAESDAPP